MEITYDIAMENGSHEAMIRQTYKDSAGVLTWSVGLTSATGHNVNRYLGVPQSIRHCLAVYVWALKNYAKQVDKAFAGYQLSKAQYAAAVSFHWNTGAIGRATWVDHFKAGRMAMAESAFKSWNKAGGKVSQGLVNRRAKEADLLFRGKWSHTGTMIEYTRLNADLTPVWSSAKRINVESELRDVLDYVHEPMIDQPPQPDKEPAAPTLSPILPEEPDMGIPISEPAISDRTATGIIGGIVALAAGLMGWTAGWLSGWW